MAFAYHELENEFQLENQLPPTDFGVSSVTSLHAESTSYETHMQAADTAETILLDEINDIFRLSASPSSHIYRASYFVCTFFEESLFDIEAPFVRILTDEWWFELDREESTPRTKKQSKKQAKSKKRSTKGTIVKNNRTYFFANSDETGQLKLEVLNSWIV